MIWSPNIFLILLNNIPAADDEPGKTLKYSRSINLSIIAIILMYNILTVILLNTLKKLKP